MNGLIIISQRGMKSYNGAHHYHTHTPRRCNMKMHYFIAHAGYRACTKVIEGDQCEECFPSQLAAIHNFTTGRKAMRSKKEQEQRQQRQQQNRHSPDAACNLHTNFKSGSVAANSENTAKDTRKRIVAGTHLRAAGPFF